MEFEMPKVPRGSGEHPIVLVVVSAKDLAAASEFYSQLFGWQVHPMSAELAGAGGPPGPPAAVGGSGPPGRPPRAPPPTRPPVGAPRAPRGPPRGAGGA